MELYKILLIIALGLATAMQYWKSFPILHFYWFLLFSLVVEVILGPWMANKYGDNTMLYNIGIIIDFAYYSFVYRLAIISNTKNTFLNLISIGIILFSIINFIWIQGPNTVNTLSYNLGMIFIFFLILRYLYALILDQDILQYEKIPLFWLSLGVLMFYSSSFPILVFLNPLIKSGSKLVVPLYNLLQVGNIFLSLSYIAALLCQRFKMKASIG